jgi:microcystin-dependent protein
MSTWYLGEIRMVSFGTNSIPTGWALCNGALLTISQYTTLFTLIGTTFGGNGETNFALPNFQGTFPVAAGGNFVIGQVGGAASVILTPNQMPTHNHSIAGAAVGGTQASPAGGYPAIESTGTSLNYAGTGGSTMNTGMVGNAGESQPVSTLPPYQCVNFIIALTGTYPAA